MGQQITELPRYKLLAPLYADDAYFEEDTVIEYDGVPNLSMFPLNEAAKVRLEEYASTLSRLDLGEQVFRAMQERPRHELQPPRQPSVSIPGTDVKPPLTGYEGGRYPKMTKDRQKTVVSHGEAKASEGQGPKKIFGTGVRESHQ